MNDLTPLQFRRIRDHLASRCGIYLDESRSAQLMGAIGQRMESRGMLSVAAYEDLLHQPGELEELRTLAELLANHETFFFRNQPHFRALRQRAKAVSYTHLTLPTILLV